MADWRQWNDDFSDHSSENIEAMVLAAATYVRASDDLRPRMLEAARLQRHERRAQLWLRRAAVIVLLLATVGGTLQQDDARHVRPLGIVMAAGFDEFFVPTAVASVGTTDGDWRMIDAFTELRRQQAQVLRMAL